MLTEDLHQAHGITPPAAEVCRFANPQEIDETCEGCFAGQAIGTFNVDGVETPLCSGCSVYRDGLNSEVILPTELA